MASYPLKSFFDQLRQNGFPLGIAEYDDFLYALNSEFLDGKDDSYEALKRLTRLLWFTPGYSRELFDELFDLSWQRKVLTGKITDRQLKPETRVPKPDDTELEPLPLPETPTKDTPEPLRDDQDTTTEADNPPISYWLSLKSSKIALDNGDRDDANSNSSSVIRFGGGYFPLSQRTLTLIWRLLKAGGTKTKCNELDIVATVESYVREASFILPVYQSAIRYNPRLVVLIDHSPSMAAFHDFSDWMTKSAPVKPFSDLPSVLYFSNVPEAYLYEDSGHQNGHSIRSLCSSFEKRPLRIMIISEAGAARGSRSRARVIATQRALNTIAPFTHSLVWVNPMPKHRWRNSSAQDIAKMVSMVEANDHGMLHAVNILRGKVLQQSNGV